MNRRSFLKLGAGAAAAAAVAAVAPSIGVPLYIPADRLEMGVPKPIIALPTRVTTLLDAALAMADGGAEARLIAQFTGISPVVEQIPFIKSPGIYPYDKSTYLPTSNWADGEVVKELRSFTISPHTYLRIVSQPESGFTREQVERVQAECQERLKRSYERMTYDLLMVRKRIERQQQQAEEPS